MSNITTGSRAEYFRKRRETLKQFVVMVDKEKFKKLDEKLKIKGISKTAWVNQKIEEEISK